jgi:hypothetical protein
VGSQFLDRFAVTHENDHASQCTFTFSDGRRCRTPRTANHSHFCFDHAQKEARATETLGKELALLLLRRLPLRLRSQRRPRSPHPRRRSRRYKTQNAPSHTWRKRSSSPSVSPSTNTLTPSAPPAGATPSAISSTATTTTSTHPSLPLNPKAKRDSSTAQADHLAGARWEEKASACFARNDSSGVCGAVSELRKPLRN